MATGYSSHHLPGDLDALQKDRNRSQTTILLPSPSPLKRVSTYYPKRGHEVLEESNADPFYLEQSLPETGHWDSFKPDARDVRFNEDDNQYFMLSTVNPAKEHTFPPSPIRRNTLRSRNINRSTLSVVELEHDLGFQEFAAKRWDRQPLHYSQGSFGSVNSDTTPDLTPSSSFSSNYSAPLHPDLVLKATEKISHQPQQANCDPGSHIYLTPCTPPRSRSGVSTQPSTPTRNSKSNLHTLNESTDTLTMSSMDPPPALSRRGKPLPTLPNIARNGNSQPNRKGQNPGSRAQIEPSMISPPSLINPVTMEPHGSHFDQSFFIPADDRPSPVPSPSAASPPITRQGTIRSSRNRPSTSTSDVLRCEQSVWESDSDSESIGPKSLSRKPIDTLRKVRSRVHLRVAKSAPKLNASQGDSDLERFPSVPDTRPEHRFPERPATMDHAPPTRDILRPVGHQTLRIVNPSCTSLPRPQSRRGSQPTEYGMDPTTAAAIQAKSRRRQRSTSPEEISYPSGEKVCTLCREERSHSTIHDSLTLARPPFFKRVWESLRVLGCHTDMTTPKPTRRSF